jgi:hypothetical protein
MAKSPEESIKQQLGKTDDHVLLVLYAHLLVEERLRDVLLAQVSIKAEELRTARLTFIQVAALRRAIIGARKPAVWDFVSRLNEARNRIVHRLDPGDLDDLLVSVATELRADRADDLATPVDRFRLAVFYVCGYFEGYKAGMHLMRGRAKQHR